MLITTMFVWFHELSEEGVLPLDLQERPHCDNDCGHIALCIIVDMHHPSLAMHPTDCAVPPMHGPTQSVHDFIFRCVFHIEMAGFLHNKSHSFGDESCQDAFVVHLHLGDRLAKKVKSDGKSLRMTCLTVPLGSSQPLHNCMKMKWSHSENLMRPL